MIAYLRALADALALVDEAALRAAAHELGLARAAGRLVLIAGNGGSAATAAHMANDLNKAASARLPFRAIALTDLATWHTALANDESYAAALAAMLAALAGPGDVFVAISTSGASANVVRAAEWAAQHGLRVVALTGPAGGRLAELAHVTVRAHAPLVGQQEDVHLAVQHALAEWLK